jgi:hypothetical protein
MNLMLLGAGASFGSPNYLVPPMGAGLFKELQLFNPPGWGALPASIARHFEADFEQGMREMASLRSHYMPILQREMAAYFFNFVPTNDSLYLRLAERVKRSGWKGTITTLNYVRLLEIALLQVGIQPVIDSQASIGQIEVCMPHGCCHLFCEGVQAAATGVSFSGVGVTFDGQVVALSNYAQFQTRIKGNSVPPVMSYFEPDKTTSSGISFIRRQRDRWAALVKEARTIVVVGARVRPSDKHLWSEIARSNAQVVFCAGQSAGEEFRLWAEAERYGKKNEVLSGYFAEKFDEICESVGLD